MFGHKLVDVEQYFLFLHRFSKKLIFSACEPPNINAYINFIGGLRNSATGPDGIPYEGWKQAGVAGASTLYGVGCEYLAGIPSMRGFNYSLSASIGKGEEEGDILEMIRAAVDTRPLALKNSDNKIVGGALNASSKPAITESANRLQRGFVCKMQGSGA